MKSRKEIAFMCMTDWDIEIPWHRKGEFPEVYKSMAALKRDRSCWRECGIVEVEVKFKRVALKPLSLKTIVRRHTAKEIATDPKKN